MNQKKRSAVHNIIAWYGCNVVLYFLFTDFTKKLLLCMLL